jgi:hypothetical protein
MGALAWGFRGSEETPYATAAIGSITGSMSRQPCGGARPLMRTQTTGSWSRNPCDGRSLT